MSENLDEKIWWNLPKRITRRRGLKTKKGPPILQIGGRFSESVAVKRSLRSLPARAPA